MKADPRFAPELAKGVKPTRNYRQWRALTKEAREKAVKEAEQLAKQGTKKAGKSTLKKAGKFVKKVPAVGLLFLVWDIKDKGVGGGIANNLLDQVPYLGWVKMGTECIGGDWIPDKE